MNGLLSQARAMSPDLIALRRAFHRIPECGTYLSETKALVCAELEKLGIPYRESSRDSGVIAEIRGDLAGDTVLFRADMDALNLTEKTGKEYSSVHDGKMHACGHDAHTAILLCAAKLLVSHRSELRGTVRLVFQTGEECGSGALNMIAEGALEGAARAYALHVGNLAGDGFESGALVIAPGAVSAGKKKFTVTVLGKTTHSAAPHRGVDPIAAASRIVCGCDEILSREVPPGEAAVLTFGSIKGGEDHNTIPASVEIKGSIRVQNDALRQQIADRFTEICENTAKAFRAECVVEMKDGSPTVVNDEKTAADAFRVVKALLGEGVYNAGREPFLAADDFSRIAQKVPSVYFMLCTNSPEKGITKPNHSDAFDLDEDVLWRGLAAVAAIALEG